MKQNEIEITGPAEQPAAQNHAQHGPVRRFFDNLGPGLITGAADDDPSGISTYATAGAAFGYGMLWTAWFSLPLMAAVQLMCARIGMVSGRGLAAVLRRYYSRRVLWLACALLLIANTVNIAADLGGMAEAMKLLTGINSLWFHLPFAVLIVALLFFTSYRTMANIFKWITLALFAYFIAAFLVDPHWPDVFKATFQPHISFSRKYLMTLVAILGTTISPYLFFWQAAQLVEEEKAAGKHTVGKRMGATREELRAVQIDVITGMTICVTVFYFIILTTGATLYVHGQREIETARQAAEALRPLAGEAAYALFALGVIGTGMLGVPVLAGSAAYAVAEAFAWRSGMNERPRLAPKFYAVIAVAMIAGVLLDYSGVNAIKMLFWSAVLNGVLAPPLIVIILVVCNNQRVMGEHVNGRWLNLLGIMAALVMTVAAVAMFFY
ncbi:MAG: Nramp family divalent metal transporter [Acidobacteria bacterium]|nr:Nramp family divalent metal transporter [Acidobacteriota bacterium]